MTEADFLTGIVARPAEPDRWLVLADWLEDQQDPRAELARLHHLLHAEPARDRPQRLARRQALLDAGLAPVVPAWTNPAGIDFALILPGTFAMGSPPGEENRSESETLHAVTLTRPYFLGVYPVTVGEFTRFVAATGYQTEGERGGGSYAYPNGNWAIDAAVNWRTPGFAQTERHPVVCVTWNDAVAMVTWLNEDAMDSGVVYALPTEAQWEYACRAGTASPFFWGHDPDQLPHYGWFNGNAGDRTHPVDTMRPNPWGLWHLAGNVWEWCADEYETYTAQPEQDPVPVTGDGSGYIRRGGSWHRVPGICRSASRASSNADYRGTSIGFRLAASRAAT
jgi:sulfatase modifying factor 1